MSTPEELHRGRLYEALVIEFGELAVFIGGWSSHAGVYLDGLLWKMSDRMHKAGIQHWPPMPGETWRAIQGEEGFYEVSNAGQIRAIFEHPRFASPRIIRPSSNGKHHQVVRLHGRVKHYIHRLVYQHFVGPIPDDKEINHIDGDPGNNRLNNLEAVSHRENMEHASRTGLLAVGEARFNTKLDKEKVLAIVALGSTLSTEEIGAQFEVSRQAVRDILAGRTWRHVTGIELPRLNVAVGR